MEYDEMTAEEYENQISDKAEFDYDSMKEEKLIAQHEIQENFNKLCSLWLELTDKNPQHANKTFREFLQTELNKFERSK